MDTSEVFSSLQSQVLSIIGQYGTVIAAVGAAALAITVATVLWFRFGPGLIKKIRGV